MTCYTWDYKQYTSTGVIQNETKDYSGCHTIMALSQ
jgi:hypothetical protein